MILMFCQSSISIIDRLIHTPKVQSDRGYWTGERGNSIYCPKHNDTVLDALHKFDLPGMPYIDGMLDPRQCTIGTVCLTQMSTKRYKNFSECDLVPTVIHSFFPHLGGVSKCKHG